MKRPSRKIANSHPADRSFAQQPTNQTPACPRCRKTGIDAVPAFTS